MKCEMLMLVPSYICLTGEKQLNSNRDTRKRKKLAIETYLQIETIFEINDKYK